VAVGEGVRRISATWDAVTPETREPSVPPSSEQAVVESSAPAASEEDRTRTSLDGRRVIDGAS
jgi:hypothetical protein